MSTPDDKTIDAFDDAQRRGWRMLSDIARQIVVGMSEVDIDAAAREKLKDHGFDRWFHAPHIRVGQRAARPWARPSTKARLAEGDLVVLDLGPSNGDCFADVGVTLRVGAGAEPEVLRQARECVRGCIGYASQWKTVGELYVYARAWAVNHRLTLASERAVGHAVLPPEGLLKAGYPKSAHLATLFLRHRMHFLHPVRMSGMWAFRPVFSDGVQAAAFEEVLSIRGDEKRILGRASLAEVGTLPPL